MKDMERKGLEHTGANLTKYPRRTFFKLLVGAAAIGAAALIGFTVIKEKPTPTKKVTVKTYRATTTRGEVTIKTYCRMCAVGCGMNAYVADGRFVRVEGMPEHPISNGRLCPKGNAAPQFVYEPNRLTYPMKRIGEKGEGKWERITWDEALDTIATKLKEVKERYGAEAVFFQHGTVSGLTSEWKEYFYRLANLFGSPNRIMTGHVCSRPRALGHSLTFGTSYTADYENTRCMMIFGSNPMASGPVGEPVEILDAKERGAKLIVVDPRRTELAAKADIWVPLRPGTDGALVLGMLNVIINEDLYDHNFVNNWTVGFDELKGYVQQFTPERVEEITWVPAETVREVARMYATIRPACVAMGNALDQHTNNGQSIRAILLLPALTGNIEVAGGHVKFPSVPTNLTKIPLKEKLPPEMQRKRIGGDKHPFYDDVVDAPLYEAMLTGKPYPVKAGITIGGNPIINNANSREGREAYKKLEFLVVVDVRMTPTAELADIVLPATTPFESEFVKTYPGYIMLRKEVVKPLGECWSDMKIMFEIAKKLGLGQYFWDGDVEKGLDYMLEPSGITVEALRRKPEGISYPLPPVRYKTYEEIDPKTGKPKGFKTTSGKVEIYSSTMKQYGYDPLPVYKEPAESPVSTPDIAKDYPLILTSGGRESVYFHSQFRALPRLREVVPYPYVEINPKKAKELGIEDGDWVIVESPRGSIKVKASYFDGIDPRVFQVSRGWWQGCEELGLLGHGWDGANVNLLIDNKARDPVNGSSAMRSSLCKVRRA